MSVESEISPETRNDIMEATSKAIRRHGYAELTMDKIAEEYDKCKSNIHYHYGTKENLMVDFIDYLLEGFKEKIVPDTEDPVEKLDCLINRMLFGTGAGDIPERLHTVLIELRSQAPYNEKYRGKITENDVFIHDKVRDIIDEGIEQGSFKEVDSDKIATIILSTIDGGRARQISTDRDVAENLRKALDQLLEGLLLKER